MCRGHAVANQCSLVYHEGLSAVTLLHLLLFVQYVHMCIVWVLRRYCK